MRSIARRLLAARVGAAVVATALAACSGASGSDGATRRAGSPGPEARADSYYPGAGRVGYDVSHYDLQLRYSPARPAIAATSTITATANRRLSSFRLDFVGLSIDGITVDGTPARYDRLGGELVISPARPIARGAEYRTIVRYHGAPRAIPDPTEDDPENGTPLGWTRLANGDVYVVSEPTGARGWFPSNDHPADKATFTITVDVPEQYAVASNGRLRPTEAQNGRRAWQWMMDQPMATYLATVVVAPMREQLTTSPGGVPIRNFFPTSTYHRGVRDFARTGEIVDFFSERFGDYPFDAYGAVTVRADLGYALETQTMSLFGRDMLGTDIDTELVVAHELAHQWFGDSVGIRRWSDIWLNEGFAHYAQYLWLAHSDPDFDLDSFMARRRAEDGDHLGRILDPGPADAFGNAVYERGALAMHALRRTIGDDAFFTVLRAWVADHAYGTATTAEFVALAERISGQDLTKFFHDWLEAETVPPLPR